jgi:hypothetical protein
MIWRILRPLLLAAVLAMISANFLMGLPGAFFIDLALPQDAVRQLGPGGLGTAIVVSMLAPFGIPVALWAREVFWADAPWWAAWAAGIAGYAAGGLAAARFAVYGG